MYSCGLGTHRIHAALYLEGGLAYCMFVAYQWPWNWILAFSMTSPANMTAFFFFFFSMAPLARGMPPLVFLVAAWNWRNSKRGRLKWGAAAQVLRVFMCRCDLCSCSDAFAHIPLSILGKVFYLFIICHPWLTDGDDRRQVVSIVFLGVTPHFMKYSWLPLLLFYFLAGSLLKILTCNTLQLIHFVFHNLCMGPWVEANRLTLYSSQCPAKKLQSALVCTAHQMGKSL